ncbi:MAG: hypothetical protein KC621_33995, partial [Myxococcales bacterium]|nr:hypothetical protein [Myxococcales bacterium]
MSGPVDGGAALTGDRTVGAVAWAWLIDGTVDGVVAQVPFEPLVYRYALDILPPPDPDDGTSSAPSTLGTEGLALLVGWPILAEPDG